MTSSTPDFGSVLRALREKKGMTQQQLADAAGTSVSHLSRLETTPRQISRQLLARLGHELGAEEELSAAAGRLPEHIEKLLATYAAATAPAVFRSKALPAFRRLEAESKAAKFLQTFPGVVRSGRVDHAALGRALHFRVQQSFTPGDDVVTIRNDSVTVSDPGQQDDPATFPRVRFLFAHAAAHVLLGEQTCVFPRAPEGEELCSDIACHLLCPEPLLRRALTAATADQGLGASFLWRTDAANVVATVAARLSIPGWVAVRRLADEALLDSEAILYPAGEQA
ncbi:helix-turn-helix domain-containing protein [Amycolatopsis sp. NBC_00438]|uniref:helix-turn-helix domain-containing protein n=1 Tax=Amycolatopsis sp. NBC_00438 TaxID=2903558 RepID=UPI002E242A0A